MPKKRIKTPKKPYSFSASKDLMDEVAGIAYDENMSVSQWVEDAIRKKLNRRKSK